MRLRLGRTRAHQYIRSDGQPLRRREGPRQQLRLVIAPLAPSAGMQWNRDDHIGGVDV
jgi:hypothetical protein